MGNALDTISNSPTYTTGSTTSKDGTTIGYRQLGHGPGLILVHGGMKSSQDFMRLGKILSVAFTVYLPDRRGRGLSGRHGDHFSVMREVEDMQALMAKTEAHYLFGLSVGGLVVLRTALTTPAVQKAAVYEPPLSINGSAPLGWVSRYEQEIARGKFAAAVVTALKGIGTEDLFNKLPRFALVPLMAFIMKLQGSPKGGKATIRSLIPTLHFEVHNINEMRDTLQDYHSLRTPTLLLDGARSPSFFRTALDGLEVTLPCATRKTFPTLGHDGPEDDGRPDLVAKELQQFFSSSLV
jgi:pimeloyl-ACP methyl ester carboxylesterase